MALWARLRRPDRVSDLVALLFRDASVDRGEFSGGPTPTFSPPTRRSRSTQTSGSSPAIAECLLQSHRGEIHLLPALPVGLGPVASCGLVARPGVETSLRWRDGELLSVTLRARDGAGGAHRIRYGSRALTVELVPGVPVELGPGDLQESAAVAPDPHAPPPSRAG